MTALARAGRRRHRRRRDVADAVRLGSRRRVPRSGDDPTSTRSRRRLPSQLRLVPCRWHRGTASSATPAREAQRFGGRRADPRGHRRHGLRFRGGLHGAAAGAAVGPAANNRAAAERRRQVHRCIRCVRCTRCAECTECSAPKAPARTVHLRHLQCTQCTQCTREVGRLLVRSTPSGASVSVDGVARGVTPLALRDLANRHAQRHGRAARLHSRDAQGRDHEGAAGATLDVRLAAEARRAAAAEHAGDRAGTPATLGKPAASTGVADRRFASDRRGGDDQRQAERHHAADDQRSAARRISILMAHARLSQFRDHRAGGCRRARARRRVVDRTGAAMNAILALEDGTWFQGVSAGAAGTHRRRSGVQHQHDRLPGSADRSVVRRADRDDDGAADWQLRRGRAPTTSRRSRRSPAS